MKISEPKLKDVKLKTILLYPPLQNLSRIPPLGLPAIQGFLKKEGYQNVETVDFDHAYNTRKVTARVKRLLLTSYFGYLDTQMKKCKITPFLKNFLKFDRVKRLLGIDPPINQFSDNWSLNRLLTLTTSYDPFYKKETKEIYALVKSFIINKNPDIVGISVVYPIQIFYSLLISKIIKEIKKEVFIVFGGPQISKHIRYLIRRKELLEIADGFIVGDGEEPLVSLIYQLSKNKNLKKVPNFYFKRPNLKKRHYYAKSRAAYFYNPLETVTPDFSGFKIKDTLPIRVSVGCPWNKCTVCTYRSFHKKNICSKPEDAVKLIRSLIKRYNTGIFQFVDDTLDTKFLERFSQLLLRENIRIQWHSYLHFQPALKNEKVIRLMAESGCRSIRFGLESMSPRILKLMNKPHKSPQVAIRILRLFKKHNIKTHIFAMFGFPSETKQEAKKTLDFLINKRYLYSFVVPQQFNLEEDTLIFRNARKFGISKVCKADKNYGQRLGFYYRTNRGMTPEESEKFVDYANSILSQKGKIVRDWGS